MAFKPNYGRDRAERQRAARARTEEKKEGRMRSVRYAKLSATQPEPRRMTSKANGQARDLAALVKTVILTQRMSQGPLRQANIVLLKRV
jgi:hypothetical protein